jgi:hypothetical protein
MSVEPVVLVVAVLAGVGLAGAALGRRLRSGLGDRAGEEPRIRLPGSRRARPAEGAVRTLPPARVVVSGSGRAMRLRREAELAATQRRSATRASDRRRIQLARDTAAAVLAITLVAGVVASIRPAAPAGGVLSETSRPAPSPTLSPAPSRQTAPASAP